MMYLDTGTYQYAAIDDLQILEKPYGAGEFSMVILLPQNGPRSLSALEAVLTETSLVKWLGAQSLETLQLYLPRFKLQTGYELRGVLEALGLRRAFDPSAADFSGMCTTENLALDKVIHKAFVEVDELGTRAAAVTAGSGFMGGSPPRPLVFRVDHPFVFLIRDNRTGGILFIGRVVNPAAA